MKHFTLTEFDCPCCHKNDMDCFFLVRLDSARDYSGCAYHINSGYRCGKHNKSVGGKSGSAHMTGKAADIGAKGSRRRFKIIEGLLFAGFNRIGIGRDFIHVDIDESKERDVLWLY